MSRPTSWVVAELAAARTEQGLTLEQVAERSGISDKAMSHWETGRYKPSGHSLEAWATALGYRIGLYMEPPQDVPEPLSPSTGRLFQELIGALAQLFDDDAEAAPEQKVA